MVGRLWFCRLLAASVLLSGCAGEKETADSNAKNVQPDVKTAKSGKTMVELETSMGNIVIELDKAAAPLTVKNFLSYVEEGFYEGTVFHRVIPDFMIQAGGFTAQMTRKQTHPPVINEASNGLKNDRGTISMARTSDPDSATSQFFINHKNNASLNYIEGRNPGYAVFGKVAEGMDVVDAIAAVRTTTWTDLRMEDVPVVPVVIKSAKVISQ